MYKRATEPMSSARFREAILEEHERLRGLIVQTLCLAETTAESAAELDGLRARARTLYLSLEEHMSFEERMLPVALRDVIGWGQALEAQIGEDHERQRQELASALEALGADTLSWPLLVESLRAFASNLLRDMEKEEDGLLDADVDAASTDGEGG